MEVDSHESLPDLTVKQEPEIKNEFDDNIEQASLALDNAVQALRRARSQFPKEKEIR